MDGVAPTVRITFLKQHSADTTCADLTYVVLEKKINDRGPAHEPPDTGETKPPEKKNSR